MAPKKRTIATKPSRSQATPDDWVKASTDPELSTPAPAVEKPAEKAPSYPHRISFDVTAKMHKALKIKGIEESRSMNEILRDAVEAYLNQ